MKTDALTALEMMRRESEQAAMLALDIYKLDPKDKYLAAAMTEGAKARALAMAIDALHGRHVF